MSLAADVKRDIKAAQKIRLSWWAVLLLLIGGMPLPWLFDHFGRPNLMLPMWNIIAVFGFLIALKWNLRRCAWFWVTIVILAALHVPLILSIPWTSQWVPALVIAVIDSVDFCLMLWIVSIVGRLAERSGSLPNYGGTSSSGAKSAAD